MPQSVVQSQKPGSKIKVKETKPCNQSQSPKFEKARNQCVNHSKVTKFPKPKAKSNSKNQT